MDATLQFMAATQLFTAATQPFRGRQGTWRATGTTMLWMAVGAAKLSAAVARRRGRDRCSACGGRSRPQVSSRTVIVCRSQYGGGRRSIVVGACTTAVP
eukprot:3498336-Rhodomonas_salina.1